MVTSGPQLGGTGDPSLHPSRRWYWVAGGLLAGGLICIALAVAGPGRARAAGAQAPRHRQAGLVGADRPYPARRRDRPPGLHAVRRDTWAQPLRHGGSNPMRVRGHSDVAIQITKWVFRFGLDLRMRDLVLVPPTGLRAASPHADDATRNCAGRFRGNVGGHSPWSWPATVAAAGRART
jgi:hypothetical protein